MACIFLSHSSNDNGPTQSLYEWLKENRFDALFLDFHHQDGIPGGSEWERELYLKLRASDAVIALCSEAYMASPWCFAEVTQARALNKTIIPVKIDGFKIDGLQLDSVAARLASAMKNLLADRQAVDLVSAGSEKYERLRGSLRAAGLDPLNSFPWDDTRPPYPGLIVYERDDAAVYFGRNQEIHAVLGLLEAGRTKRCPSLIVVVGPSGSGKSSLVRAGVVPRLDRQQWHVLPPLCPGPSPIASLARTFAACNASEFPPDPVALRELLRRDSAAGGRALIDSAEHLAASLRGHAAVLLVIDQWEELLGPSSEETERDRAGFHAIVRRVVEAPDSSLVVLATLRSDFFDAFQNHRDWVGLSGGVREIYHLGPMPTDRFSQVVEGPTARGRVTFDPGLVTRIVQDAKNADALPLLAFALRELYERRDSDGRMTFVAYEQQVKGIQGALMHAVNKAIGDDLTEEVESVLRRVFVSHLVHVNQKGPYLRQRARWDDLPTEVQPLLERFVTARLLTTHSDDGHRTVEVVHETLFQAWNTLAGWLMENRALLLWRDRMEVELAAWRATQEKQRRQFLLTGARAAEARRWLEGSSEFFKTDEREFLKASVAAEKNRILGRRILSVATLLMLLAVIMGGLFAFSENQYRQAEARNHRLTRLAKTRLLQDASLDRERRGDHGTSAVLLGHALVEAEGQGANLESALRVAITLARSRLMPLRSILDVSGNLRGCAMAPDGRLAVVGTDRGEVLFVDPRNGQLTSMAGKPHYSIGQNPVDDSVTDVAFESSGPLFAVSTNSGKVHVVDSKSGDARIISHAGRSMSVCFSPDGRTLLVAGWVDEKRHGRRTALALYDIATGAIIRDFHVTYDLYSAAISPDGRWVVAGGGMPPDPRLTVWDLTASDDLLGHELPQPARIFTMSFRPAHTGEFVTGDVNGVVRFWHLARGNVVLNGRPEERWETRSPEIHHDKQVRVTAFSEDGRLLLIGGEDNSARLWDAETRSPIGQRLEHRGQVRAGAVSIRAERVIAADFAGDIRVFDLRAATPAGVVLRHPGPVREAMFNSSGDRVLTGFDSSPDGPGGGRVWNITGGPPIDLAHGADVLAGLFRPNIADRAVTCGNDGTVAYWDTRTGQRLGTLNSSERKLIYTAAFHPTGNRFAFAESGRAVIHVCDFDRNAGNFRTSFQLKYPEFSFVWNLRFIADGRLLSDGRYGVCVWSAQAGDQMQMAEMLLHRWPQSEGQKLDIWLGAVDQHASRALALASDGSVTVCNLSDLREAPRRLGETPHGSGQLCADWHGASDKIATGGPNGVVRLWYPDGTQIAEDLIHPSPVEVLTFSPDGQWLATGGRDGGIRLWRVAGGVWTGAGWYHNGPVTRVRFSPDGRYLLSASRDSTARVVPVPVETTGKSDKILADLQADAGVLVEVKGTGASSAATAPHPLTAEEYRELRGRAKDKIVD